MEVLEKLGTFYLGKIIDNTSKKKEPELLFYDSKNLTTHGVILGMTGSGKTGLGISILEEAGLDKVPAIIIDPKGDLTNLLLTFPQLSAEEFQPWIDKAEADREGLSTLAYAETVAKKWTDGLASSGEDAQRIQHLRDNVEMCIYTPASSAGLQISILNSFKAPSKEFALDAGAMRDRILSITSGILGLLGINADPIKSREHILLSTIISNAWNAGKDLDIPALIREVQKPSFSKIGVLDIDTFFPAKERMALAISLNNLLASPGFKAWMEGEPLDIQNLLYTSDGKPKLSVLSIAHLGDSERMFFVTLLLNEFLTWMRRQSGTTSLRALLYMDEVAGFFPPTAMPPSKTPMITLLKQARAFGVGIVLSTQNPVDLDYKGLSNCGTWFIGKLQTERDKARVIEGLQTASNGEIDAKQLDTLLATIPGRTFVMRSIYEKNPIEFQTRWTMSYLRGPLTLAQISKLVDKHIIEKPQPVSLPHVSSERPNSPPGVPEYFVSRPELQPPLRYKPFVFGLAKLHFVDAKMRVDMWKDLCIMVELSKEGNISWDTGVIIPNGKNVLSSEPLTGSSFDDLPAALMQEKNYAQYQKTLAASLFQTQVHTIYKLPSLNMTSKDSESEADFRIRIGVEMREKRDEAIQKIRDKYEKKITTLRDKVRKAQDKVAQKSESAGMQKAQTWISVGTTLLGAVFGRGVTKGTINSAGSSLKKVGRISKDSKDVESAEADVNACQQQLDDVQLQMQQEITALTFLGDASTVELEKIQVRPRKGDIAVDKVGLAWVPH